MWVLIREASNARNLLALLEMVREHGPDYCAFCTDDREPDYLHREGHIDEMCRRAVGAGIAAEDVLLMASLHGARAHRLFDRGAIAPGYVADLVLLDDLTSFSVSRVLKGGREPVYPEGVAAGLRDTMRAVPVAFGIPGSPERVRVIDVNPGQLITGAGSAAPRIVDGHVVADPERDLAKIAVIERHHATGRVGLGLVRGFGLREGAFCSTVAHDAHNLVVVGVSDADMEVCAARAQELGGGIVVARDGEVRGELALPIAGLLSDRPLEAVAEGLEALQDLLAEQGVAIGAPFMTLSFLALSVIPSVKITDLGLVDVDAFALVPLELTRREAFVARFGALYEHSPWVAERAWRDDLDGIDEIDAALRAAMHAASRDEQLALIRAHPDLGEKVAPLTDHSRAEQATLKLSGADYDRFAATNAAYRAKFGIPFVICVREHTTDSILAAADARLDNTVDQEIETALGEIGKIARLRLEDVF
jgi:adenine deaminase